MVRKDELRKEVLELLVAHAVELVEFLENDRLDVDADVQLEEPKVMVENVVLLMYDVGVIVDVE